MGLSHDESTRRCRGGAPDRPQRRHCAHGTYSATKWLSDDRKNGPLNTSDSDWARDDWFPRALAAGWKYWAVVLPELLIGQMNMQLFTTRYSKAGVTVRVFSDPDDALCWLKRPTTMQPSATAPTQG